MSNHLSVRRVLIGLVAAAITLVIPAAASATITPTLTLDQTAGTTAGSSPNIGFDFKFAPTAGDSPKDITQVLPPGLLADATINGGACLASSTPAAACQIGSGTIASGAYTGAVSLYLVKAPKAADVAGEALVFGSSPGSPASVADVTFDPARGGLDVANTGLLNIHLTELNITFSHLRMPTSCPTPKANVTVSADSQTDATVKTTTAPLTVTGCGALPYAPTLSATAVKDTSDPGVTVGTTVSQAANEATSSKVVLGVPVKTLQQNPAAVGLVCLDQTLATCKQVGTASANSPLLPLPLTGKVYLTQVNFSSPLALTIAFPPPFALRLDGTISLSANTVTFSNVPDVPLTRLAITLTGGPQSVYATSCVAPTGTVTGSFTSQNRDQTVNRQLPLTVHGCPPKAGSPTISGGSLKGLAKRKAKLSFTLSAGQNAPKLSSFKVSLPKGLSFIAKNPVKGLSVTGATVKSAKVSGGKLVVTLKSASASLTAKLNSKLLKVSKGLSKKVKKHKVKKLKVKVTVTDSSGTSTPLTLVLKKLH